MKIIRVSDKGVDVKQDSPNAGIWVKSEDAKYKFDLKLRPIIRPQWNYSQPDKVLVVSDPHGDINAFVSILQAQHVIDKNCDWSFDKGHLVVIGDVFDRGQDVLPIFWLIYKLEEQAAKAKGCVHFLLGNHEEMVLRNNMKYAEDKYKHLAQELDCKYSNMWQSDSELGRWLQTRNTIEKIGDNLFVHAGLSKEFLERNISIPQLNDSVSVYLRQTKAERNQSENATFLFGNNGPLWYRGMVRTDEKYNPISESDVDAILNQYNVKRIYVGHTIFGEVSSFYNGKVIAVNVNNNKNKNSGLNRGVLIKKNEVFLIYDDSQKNKRLE